MKRLFSQTVKTFMGLLLFWGIVMEGIKAQTRLEDLDTEEFSKSFETRYIPSENMTPTLEIGDRLLIDKKTYQTETPQRKDLVIFNPTKSLLELDYNQPFVKRIIGLPGDNVEVKEGKVYINEEPLEEDYIESPPAYVYGPVKVPSGNYFVLGDNRNNSYDSHYWGFVPKDNIYGRIIGIYCPIDRQGILTEQVDLDSNQQKVIDLLREFFQQNPNLCDLKTNA